jgi:hypothetical protein
MVDLYLYLLIAICLGLLSWGLIRLERIYQYPFFMGGIFVSFIAPQAIALINKPGPVSQQALERVLLMSCLCAAMCWLGYQLPPSQNFIKKLDLVIDPKRFFQGGIVFVLIGFVSNLLISRLPDAAKESTQWTGVITIYVFFSSLIYPGFTILLLSTLRRATVSKIILTACAAALPIQTIIFYGRRESTATFVLAIGLSLYFVRRFVPPRWVAVTLVILALFAIPLTGTYRTIAKTGKWEQLYQIKPLESLSAFVEEGEFLELRNAALLMDAAVQTNQYGYGTDYWNTLVFRFIPAQLVGKSFKDFLQIKLVNYDLESMYRYKLQVGLTITGIGDSFTQFDYLGCFFFFLIAYLFKNLWISAIYRDSIISQIFYVSLFAPAMISVTHETARFLPDLLFNFIFFGALTLYSRQKSIARTEDLKDYPEVRTP